MKGKVSKVAVRQAVLRGLQTGGVAGGGRHEDVEVPFGETGMEGIRNDSVRGTNMLNVFEGRIETVWTYRASWCEKKYAENEGRMKEDGSLGHFQSTPEVSRTQLMLRTRLNGCSACVLYMFM